MAQDGGTCRDGVTLIRPTDGEDGDLLGVNFLFVVHRYLLTES